MGLFDNIRGLRSKHSQKSKRDPKENSNRNGFYQNDQLPAEILSRIFAFVCPQSVDETYESSEKSLDGFGCPLCDLKDLSNCALVTKAWLKPVRDVL